MRKAGVPREVCDSDRNVLPIRTVHLVFDSERTVHHATGDPFVSWTLRCAKRENQDLSVLVTRGASARGARARGPRPEARCPRPEVRGPRSEVRDRGVSARSQPEVCVTREVAKQFIQHNTVIHSSYMTHYFMLNMISLRISCCLYGIYRL
jgi:hypothetical protein